MNTALTAQLGWSILAGVVTALGSWGVTNPGTVWAALSGVISKFKWKWPMPTPKKPKAIDVHAALDALLLLHKYAEQRGCPKLTEAVNSVDPNFLNNRPEVVA